MNQTDTATLARWYAIRVIGVYFVCIATFVVLAYLDLRWMFGVLAAWTVVVLASAIYRDLYYDKLMELEKQKNDQSDQSRTN